MNHKQRLEACVVASFRSHIECFGDASDSCKGLKGRIMKVAAVEVMNEARSVAHASGIGLRAVQTQPSGSVEFVKDGRSVDVVLRVCCPGSRVVFTTRTARLQCPVHGLRVHSHVLVVDCRIGETRNPFLIIGILVFLMVGKDNAHFVLGFRKVLRDV